MTTLLDKEWPVISDIQNRDEATLDRVLSRIAALAPVVQKHAGDMDRARRLPSVLVSALKSARIYSLLVCRRYGGLELDAPSAFRAISALAKLDGSVGWNAMIGQFGSLIPFLANPTLCEKIFQDGKDHVIVPPQISQLARPSALAEDGGFPASGRLPAGARMPTGSEALA